MNRVRARKSLAFEAFGVKIAVHCVDGDDREAVRALLPPGSRPAARNAAHQSFSLLRDDDRQYAVTRGERTVARRLSRRMAFAVLDSEMRSYVALHAAERIFVHAGAVAVDGRAVLMPGVSFAGKTTLVAALVRAGAVYYSDEYAVLDEEGRVHPYGKPLSLRDEHLLQTEHDVTDLGGTQGVDALPVGVILETSYSAGAEWQPQRGSAGDGAMILMANTVPARSRPLEVMRAISRAADGAVVLRGDRGDADALVPVLLDMIEREAWPAAG